MSETSEQARKASAAFDKVAPLLERLADRWRDESQYESLASYATHLRGALPIGVRLVRLHTDPFGATLAIAGNAYRVDVLADRVRMVHVGKAKAARRKRGNLH